MSFHAGRLAVLVASLLAPAAGYNAAISGLASTTPTAFSAAAARRTAPHAVRCEVSTSSKIITCGRCKATYVVEDLEAFGDGLSLIHI